MAVNRPAARRIASSRPEPSPGAVNRSLRAAASMAAASELRILPAVNCPAPAPQVALDCDSQQRANGRPFLAGVVYSETMNSPGRSQRVSPTYNLLDLLKAEFPDAPAAHQLFAGLLHHESSDL